MDAHRICCQKKNHKPRLSVFFSWAEPSTMLTLRNGPICGAIRDGRPSNLLPIKKPQTTAERVLSPTHFVVDFARNPSLTNNATGSAGSASENPRIRLNYHSEESAAVFGEP